jgi:hypothetical protein
MVITSTYLVRSPLLFRFLITEIIILDPGFSRGAYQIRVLAGMLHKVFSLFHAQYWFYLMLIHAGWPSKRGQQCTNSLVGQSSCIVLCAPADNTLSAFELYEACTSQESQADSTNSESKFSALFEKMEGIAAQKGGALFKSAKQNLPSLRKAFKSGKEARPPKPSPDAMCKQFKETMSRPDVRVHFVGAW